MTVFMSCRPFCNVRGKLW